MRKQMRQRTYAMICGLLTVAASATTSFAADKALIDTTKSPNAKMYMPDMADVKWTGGLMGDRFNVCRTSMIPYMWSLYEDPSKSKSWMNFQVAAEVIKAQPGLNGGPAFNDGDFLKWFESVASMYAVTKDPELDKLMDSIIPVIAKAQRADGYLFTQQMIKQNRGERPQEFSDPDHFETYNMGHLMTAACVHYRATGKTSMLDLAKKSADLPRGFLQRCPRGSRQKRHLPVALHGRGRALPHHRRQTISRSRQ